MKNNDELQLDVGQAVELKEAFRRGPWTNAKIKRLCEGNLLTRVCGVIDGLAEIVMKKIAVWRRFMVDGVSKSDLLNRLTEGNFRLSDWARDMIGRKAFTVSRSEEADFAIVTPKDLGFEQNPTTEELFDEKNLSVNGLKLCKPDDGPTIRLCYTDQPDGEWLWLGMKPIVASDGSAGVFRLYRGGSGLWLGGDYAGPQNRWSLDVRVVFRLRK